MSHTKAQVSMEFMALISLMVLIFVAYTPFFWQQQKEIQDHSEYMMAKRILSSVKKEVDTAVMFGDGYTRNFTVPSTISGIDYGITVNEEKKMVTLFWKDKITYEFLIAHNITGNPVPGQKNKIENRDDVIVFS